MRGDGSVFVNGKRRRDRDRRKGKGLRVCSDVGVSVRLKGKREKEYFHIL